jgi:ABC-2 type transport system permease protein
LLFVIIYYFLAMYYFGFSFEFYSIHRLADPLMIVALLTPFLFASSFIGSVLGTILPRRELVTALVLICSMPLIFCAGFIWPLESIPQPLIWLSNAFPSTPAIQAFLKINQMGASFEQVISQWSLLWVQFVVWGAIAYLVDKLLRVRS